MLKRRPRADWDGLDLMFGLGAGARAASPYAHDWVQCHYCGSVYHIGWVTIVGRYADCSSWFSPCCGRYADDRQYISLPMARAIEVDEQAILQGRREYGYPDRNGYYRMTQDLRFAPGYHPSVIRTPEGEQLRAEHAAKLLERAEAEKEKQSEPQEQAP